MDSRQRQHIVLGLAGLFVLTQGAMDVIYPAVLDNYILISVLISSFLGIYWMYLDAADQPGGRPKVYAIVVALVFVPLGILLHLIEARGWTKGLAHFFAACLSVIACYLIGSGIAGAFV